MFFKLFNILASFQNDINKILVKKFDVIVIVYLNHILIDINDKSHGHVETIQ